MNEEFITQLVRRTADLAVGPSTVRNQGAAGVVKAARKALRGVVLERYKDATSSRFGELLDRDTVLLRRKLPRGARNWGTARKCLNIFLRDVLYNRFLSDHFRFSKFEPYLEIPLDGYVARGLSGEEEGWDLPRWRTIKSLAPEANQQ